MAARKIILTPKAEEDLREIFLYLSNYSLDAADAHYIVSEQQIDVVAIHFTGKRK